MIQAARIIGTGIAITGLIGAGVGIGVVFAAYAILGLAFAYATGLNSPAKPHAFLSLPLQSNIFSYDKLKNSVKNKFSLGNIVTFLVITLIILFLRNQLSNTFDIDLLNIKHCFIIGALAPALAKFLQAFVESVTVLHMNAAGGTGKGTGGGMGGDTQGEWNPMSIGSILNPSSPGGSPSVSGQNLPQPQSQPEQQAEVLAPDSEYKTKKQLLKESRAEALAQIRAAINRCIEVKVIDHKLYEQTLSDLVDLKTFGPPVQVPDPKGIGIRGYISNGTNQPYARELCVALQAQFNNTAPGNERSALPNMDANAARFLRMWLAEGRPDILSRTIRGLAPARTGTYNTWEVTTSLREMR